MISSPSKASRTDDRLRKRRRRLCTAAVALASAFWLAAAHSQDNAVRLTEGDPSTGNGATAESAIQAKETLYFRFADTSIDASAGRALDRIVTRLLADDTLRVSIAAHTDDRGWSLGNIELSRQRARAVARALVMQGMDVERMSARAFGESMPAASNETVEGRRRNRRVDIVLLR